MKGLIPGSNAEPSSTFYLLLSPSCIFGDFFNHVSFFWISGLWNQTCFISYGKQLKERKLHFSTWVMQMRWWLSCIIHLKRFYYISPTAEDGGINCILCIPAEINSSPHACTTALAALMHCSEPGLCHCCSSSLMSPACGCSTSSTSLLNVSPGPEVSREFSYCRHLKRRKYLSDKLTQRLEGLNACNWHFLW